MTILELDTLLKTSGYPVAAHHFEGAPESIPFIAYLTTGSGTFGADNKVYFKSPQLQVELYTNQKDETAEANVEALFDGADIFYSKDEAWIDSEDLYMVSYSITI